jgi:hypothetical protein
VESAASAAVYGLTLNTADQHMISGAGDDTVLSNLAVKMFLPAPLHALQVKASDACKIKGINVSLSVQLDRFPASRCFSLAT